MLLVRCHRRLLLCCVVAVLATRKSLNVADAVYLAITIWLYPRIGSGAVFALIVTGHTIATLSAFLTRHNADGFSAIES